MVTSAIAGAMAACSAAAIYSSHMNQDNNYYHYKKRVYYIDYTGDKLIRRLLKSIEAKAFADLFTLITSLRTNLIFKYNSIYTDDFYFNEDDYIQPNRLNAKELDISYSWWFKSFVIPEYTKFFLDNVRRIENNNIEAIFRSNNRKYFLKISSLDKNFKKLIMNAELI